LKWNWTCKGSNGGRDVYDCWAYKTGTSSCDGCTPVGGCTVTGRCGSANGTSSSTAPTTGLCACGTSTTPLSWADNGVLKWNWTCKGSNGGRDVYDCWAYKGSFSQNYDISQDILASIAESIAKLVREVGEFITNK
jgi:hypothetical protein